MIPARGVWSTMTLCNTVVSRSVFCSNSVTEKQICWSAVIVLHCKWLICCYRIVNIYYSDVLKWWINEWFWWNWHILHLIYKVIFQAKIPNIITTSSFSVVRIFYFFISLQMKHVCVLDCCLDKRSQMKIRPWLLGTCDWHLSLISDFID